jgi:carboxyl-terminal processing protease
MMTKKMQVWLPLLLSGVMAAGMLLGYQLQQRMGSPGPGMRQAGGAQSVQQVMDLVRLRYVDSIGLDSIESAAIEDMVSLLDPHSVYIPPNKLNDVNTALQGNFSGIGVEYQWINDTVTFVYVLPNGPAGKVGVLAGDQLLRVDTTNVSGRPLPNDTLRQLLRGANGTTVQLRLLRKAKIVASTITRGNVPMPSLDAAYMVTPQVGYIRLNKFAETTYREFMDAATDLQKQGMTKMMLDLRGNGGGFLDAATNIADELLPDGKLIVSTRGNHVKTKEIRSTKPGIFETGDLVLLIDEFSASASEVLAGALQDNDRGTIVGRRSFGKGLVQEQYDLKNGGALRLTVARYYTPTNRSIQKPYANGQKENYQSEVFDRFSDTVKPTPDSSNIHLFTTKKGKKLYDGGGITPDVTVPFDSGHFRSNNAALPGSDVLSATAFDVFKAEQTQLQAIPSAQQYNKSFSMPAWVWPTLVQRAQKDSIRLNANDTLLRNKALLQTKALLARYIWRGTGYFTVANTTDPLFNRGLEVLTAPKP